MAEKLQPKSTDSDQDPNDELKHILDQWIFRKATIYLMVVTTLISLATFVKFGWSVSAADLYFLGAGNGSAIAKGEFWRLFNPLFLHGNLMHLFLNMYALYSVGSLCNYIYSTRAYLFLYLVCGIFGCILSGLTNPIVVSIGASGAILGLYGMILAAFLTKENDFKKLPKSIASNLLAGVVITFAVGLSTKGISNTSHLGGILSGFILGFIYLKFVRRSHRQIQFAGGVLVTIAILCFTLFPLFVKPARFTAVELSQASKIYYLIEPMQQLWASTIETDGGNFKFKRRWQNELGPWWKRADSEVKKMLVTFNLPENSLLHKRSLNYLSVCEQVFQYDADGNNKSTDKTAAENCVQSFNEIAELLNPY